jgi:hypothetical protein
MARSVSDDIALPADNDGAKMAKMPANSMMVTTAGNMMVKMAADNMMANKIDLPADSDCVPAENIDMPADVDRHDAAQPFAICKQCDLVRSASDNIDADNDCMCMCVKKVKTVADDVMVKKVADDMMLDALASNVDKLVKMLVSSSRKEMSADGRRALAFKLEMMAVEIRAGAVDEGERAGDDDGERAGDEDGERAGNEGGERPAGDYGRQFHDCPEAVALIKEAMTIGACRKLFKERHGF